MTRNAAVRKGFTLIELMAVVLILAILAGVALPKFFNYQIQAREASCKGTLGGVRAGIANFYADKAVTTGTGLYPTQLQLTDGSTMQEAIPANPYDAIALVRTATLGESAVRTVPVAEAAGGWAYYPGAGANKAVFYANTATASPVTENNF